MNFIPGGSLPADPKTWVEPFADLARAHGVSGFIVAIDDHTLTRRYAEEVAPAVRELVGR
jgi:hypothetical protein